MMVSIVQIYLVIYNWNKEELFHLFEMALFVCFMISHMIEFLRVKGEHYYVS